MVDEDLTIPAFLRLTAEERLAGWAGHTPRPVEPVASATKPADPSAVHILAELAAMEKIKTKNRIAKMLDRKASKEAVRTGQTWNPQTCKWE